MSLVVRIVDEVGQRRVRADVVESDLYPLPDVHGGHVFGADVAEHPHSFVEIDQCNDVGHCVTETGCSCATGHGEGVDDPRPADFLPLQTHSVTVRAQHPWVEHEAFTTSASLYLESMLPQRLPVRAAVVVD